LCWETMRDDNKLGEHSEREYNDWTAVQDLTGLPDDAFHKNVDDLVLSSGSESVKTAILCPPTIYGMCPDTHCGHRRYTDTIQDVAEAQLTSGVGKRMS
jgi:hypothetical protein